MHVELEEAEGVTLSSCGLYVHTVCPALSPEQLKNLWSIY